MRLLIFSESIDPEFFQKEVDFFKDKLFSQVDTFTSYDTAEYCVDIRTYDLIFVEYNPMYHKKYYNILGSLQRQDHKKSIYLFGDNLSRARELFENYDFINRIDGLNFSLIEEAEKHVSTSEKEICKNSIKIDLRERSVYFDIKEDKEKNIEASSKTIKFKKEFDFLVVLYFIRHYDNIIKVSALLDATCEEPEEKKDSLIEASISKIRKEFACTGGINPIRSYKKIGYKFSMDQIETGE